MAGIKIKKGPFIALVIIVAGVFGLRYAHTNGYLSPADSGPSAVPEVADLPDVDPQAPVAPMAVAMAALPSTTPVAVQSPEMRFLGMTWNAQLALALANGGPRTTSGSLMEKHGVNLVFTREDDVGKMQTQLIAFAKALKNGDPQPTGGAHFMAVMGDGSAATIAGMWEELKALGPEYQPEVIGSAGYSRGEDALWGPAAWKANPKLMRGSLIAAYLRDGDWNIVLKYADDNGIKNNPDERTYDPEAINWYSTSDFIQAGAKLIEGVCEDRPEVREGKRTGKTVKACVNGAATWSPVDATIADELGGVVPVVSTREYRSQMPNAIIGIRKWDLANRPLVEKFLTAMYEAGDQVKLHPAALTRGAAASAEVYKERDAQFWETLFRGTVRPDKQGVPVQLGGSSVNNLQDALRLFGLAPGVPNLFAATYTTFGNVVRKQYPRLVPSFPPVGDILNTSYTENIAKTWVAPQAPADVPTFAPATAITQVVSKRDWQISFDTGLASFSPSTMAQLEALKDGLLVADELAIEIHGHTDSTGDAAKNLALSQRRAEAVRAWLMEQGSATFPRDRFAKVQGHGSEMAAASNDTETGRAKNRRVVVILGR